MSGLELGLAGGAVAPALCGALVGAGIYLAIRSAFPSTSVPARPVSAASRGMRGAAWPGGPAWPAGPGSVPAGSSARWAWAGAVWLTARVERAAGSSRARRILLADDLAVVGGDTTVHTAARLARAVGAAGVAVGLIAVSSALGVALPALLAPAAILFAGLLGVVAADRPVRRRAAARRQEARLAVAAYVDLVRILLVGGLPFHAALRIAADSGRGWAFGQIRGSLDWARARRLPPDAGLEHLAAAIPLAEFRELRLTVTSALRGASPVVALESKAVHLRAAEAAQARTESAVADAEMELPAAVVALAFVAFLTFPLLAILTGSGTTP